FPNSGIRAKAARRSGGQPRPAPMQGRPPIDRPWPRPPARGQLATARASPKGRPAVPARGSSHPQGRPRGASNRSQGRQLPAGTVACSAAPEKGADYRVLARGYHMGGHPLAGRLPTGKGSRHLPKGSSGGGGAEGTRGVRASF
ncbi:hypothetical protein GW17_00056053, partial [Ensete ventricosum]